jgi:uncharacterized protein (TIGR02271 family)
MKLDSEKVRVGMVARTTKGEKLGKIIRLDEDGFIVEKGTFFPKDYQLYHEYIAEVRGNEVIYALEDARAGRREFTETERGAGAQNENNVQPLRAGGHKEGIAGAASGAVAAVKAKLEGGKEKAEARAGRSPAEPQADRLLEHDGEMRIPLMDEEITVEMAREAGHVRIHKEVRLEERHITVPVRREEVVIERLPASQSTVAPMGAEAFREQTVDLPLSEEELRVTKHSVVREELRVRRVSYEEQREAAATLRHEEVEIEDTTQPARTHGREESALAAAAEESGFKKT